MVLLPMPSDALRNPVQWNLDWEVLFRPGGQLVFPRGPALAYSNTLRELEAAPNSADKALAEYQQLVSSTSAVQRNITEEALYHFTYDDFEARWMNSDADVRGQHILGAMADVCSKTRNLNEARSYCPEIRLMRLRLDGKVFLDLVKSVMLGDASFIPSQSIYISHSAWEAWAATLSKESDAEKIAVAEIQILRTKLICHVVQFTIMSFFGKDAPRLVVHKEHKSSKTENPFAVEARNETVAQLGPEAAKARFKEEKAGFKARQSERLGTCSYIGCKESESKDGSVKFARCKVCFDKLQRQVLYCSATCQRADWKLRHKAVCGKPFDFETAARVVEHPTAVVASHTRIGPPMDGFKRSIALTAQVTILNQNPTIDYRLYNANHEYVDVDFGEGRYTQHVFRVERELAMTTGNHIDRHNCVARMAHYLCAVFSSNTTEDKQGITPDLIVAQLAREFEFDGLREAVLLMQQAQNEDPLHRPPLLDETTPEQWFGLSENTDMASVVVVLN
ncbi:hypothetical protein DFH06DRAFT_691584 [Mycena polygramma]|nr:hypothetical protein DFH06DRAFT_691584 [Mycena polygramma]